MRLQAEERTPVRLGPSSRLLPAIVCAALLCGIHAGRAAEVPEATPNARTRVTPTPTLPAYGADLPRRGPRGDNWDTWGEARVRGVGLSHFISDENGRTLDQQGWMMTRILAGGRWNLTESLRAELELSLASGQGPGDTTRVGTRATDDPFPVARNNSHDLTWVVPRKAYLAWLTDIGRFTFGFQTFMWGTGMLANDGAQDTLFGDPWLGNVVGRIGYSLRPLEKSSLPDLLRAMAVFVAADAVLQDDNALLYEGDEAFSGQTGVRAQQGGDAFGLLVTGRYQKDRYDRYRPNGQRSYTGVAVIDLHGKVTRPVAEAQHLSLEAEGATILGHSTRAFTDATWEDGSSVRSFAGLARLRWDHDVSRISVLFESGYASGDNDPIDRVSHTFTMNTDYNVGLVLFDQVLPLLSARSADKLSSPGLLAQPPPSTRFTINPGGVQNAIYLNPIVVWRPLLPLKLRAGWLWAIPAADLIDAYQTAIRGGYATSTGGRVQYRGAYGHELDVGATWDFDLPEQLILRTGAEGGVLFPGTAFSGVPGLRPAGGGVREQWCGQLKLALLW